MFLVDFYLNNIERKTNKVLEDYIGSSDLRRRNFKDYKQKYMDNMFECICQALNVRKYLGNIMAET